MRNKGLSDRVRSLVSERYLQPAIKAGKSRVTISVKDVLNDFSQKDDFPRFRTPVICQALLGDKLLTQNGLEIETVDGPPSKQSRTVVVHYRVVKDPSPEELSLKQTPTHAVESPEARAKRVTESLRGLLKNEIAAFGGTEAFMRWVRSDADEPA